MKKDQGASLRGYHYFNELQQCPRRWYLHHELRLEPITEKPSLLFGKAWHLFIEGFLRDQTPETALATALEYLKDNRERYTDSEKYDQAVGWLRAGALPWIGSYKEFTGQAFGNLGKPFIDSVEDTFETHLTEDIIFTGRTDGRIQFPDGRKFVLEHKSTSWYPAKIAQAIEEEDQVTGYLFGLKRMDSSLACDGVILDVTTFKPAIPRTEWYVISRSAEDLVNFQLSLLGIALDLKDRLESLHSGVNPFVVFPRNGAWCGQFGCPYESICRSRLEQQDLTSLEGFIIKDEVDDVGVQETTD